MPDIAKKTRIINARAAKAMQARQRNIFTIEKQIRTLQRQEGYYKNLQDEVKNDFYNVNHDYSFEYREKINCQLLFLETMKLQVQEAIANLNLMKQFVINGEF
jgi:hypothetical protein